MLFRSCLYLLARLAPAAKKLKGAPKVPSGAAPLPTKEGGCKAQASPARSSSRGLVELAGASSAPVAQATPEVSLPDATAAVIGVQKVATHGAVITLPSSPPTPPTAISPAPSTIMDCAATELDRLRGDLQGTDPRLVAGRLELASGWVRSDASVRAALVQATTACDKDKQAILQVKAARDAPWVRLRMSGVAARRLRASCKACTTSSPRRPVTARRRRKR